MSLQSYPKVYALGHAAIPDVWDGEVVIQEKVDGSQFSFGVKDGKLSCRSKSVAIDPECPPKLFALAVKTVAGLADRIKDGCTYRGEAVTSPRHNTLSYSRIPAGGVVLFDVSMDGENYLSPGDVFGEAARLGLECVPMIYRGTVEGTGPERLAAVKEYLERESFLGGPKIEGVVVKNYHRFGKDGRAQFGKFVREEFKEANHSTHAKVRGKDVVTSLGESLNTEARFRKAVCHLRDAGLLDGSPKDIGPLLKAVNEDVLAEEGERIKEHLFKWAWKDISKIATRGLPQWYKEQLVSGGL